MGRGGQERILASFAGAEVEWATKGASHARIDPRTARGPENRHRGHPGHRPDDEPRARRAPQGVYDRMKELLYDDSPWTDEEMDALAWEAGQHAGWGDMDEYDNYPEKP